MGKRVLELRGSGLSLKTLVFFSRAPRDTILIKVAASSIENMKTNRKFAETVAGRGDAVYGLSVGVGVRKNRDVERSELVEFNNRMVRDHKSAIGPSLPTDVVRAAAILLLNTLAAGRTNVRPMLASHFADRLSNGPELQGVPIYGGTGVGDVAQLPFLILDLLRGFGGEGDIRLTTGEALPLIAQSSIVAAHSALAIYDTEILLEELTANAALDLEAYSANPSPYSEMVGTVRPYAGYQKALRKIRNYLHGGSLTSSIAKKPKHLQTPLSFRTLGIVLGSAFDALSFCKKQIAVELNAHQQNPLVLEEEDRMMGCGNFDMQAVAAMLDFMRIAVAPCLTSQTERSIKLLQKSETGLTDGLEPLDDAGGHGLSEIAWPLQGLCVEAKSLVTPVSCEIGSSSQAEGIEDRMSMAGLSARRLHDMVALGFRCLSISTVISNQAIDLRNKMEAQFQQGTDLEESHRRMRELVPEMKKLSRVPGPDAMEALYKGLQDGLLSKCASKRPAINRLSPCKL